jgi:hypothetical protein
MDRIKFGFTGLLLAGACATLVGCVENSSQDQELPEPPAKTAQPDGGAARAGTRDQLLKAHHDRCTDLFVKTQGNGLGRFQALEHASPTYPRSLDLPLGSQPPFASSPWLMHRVELVSLLKEKEGVYPANGMRGLFRKAPKTRELDGFEQRALARLKAGEQMQVDESADHVRVLGAIRMQNACKGCHAGKKEGDLLGAFTYVFKPAS